MFRVAASLRENKRKIENYFSGFHRIENKTTYIGMSHVTLELNFYKHYTVVVDDIDHIDHKSSIYF